MKFVKWTAGTIAFGLAFFAVKYGHQWLRNNDPGLTGTARSAFIEEAIRTCLKKQKGDPINKGILESILSQYCKCYANGMADRISINELKSLSAVRPAEAVVAMQPKIEAAAKPCQDAAAASLPKSN